MKREGGKTAAFKLPITTSNGKIKSLQCLSSVRKDIDTKVSTCKDHGFRGADSILVFGNAELPEQIKQIDEQYRNATGVSKWAFTF